MSAIRQKTDRVVPRSAFKPGQSGNPSGRPKIPADVREATRAACPEAIALLVSIMRDEDEKTAYRMDAAKTLLERAYGKPMQMQDIALDVSGTMDMTAQIRRVLLETENDGHGAEGTD